VLSADIQSTGPTAARVWANQPVRANRHLRLLGAAFGQPWQGELVSATRLRKCTHLSVDYHKRRGCMGVAMFRITSSAGAASKQAVVNMCGSWPWLAVVAISHDLAI